MALTLREYLCDRKWLYHERGLDAEWEVLYKIAISVPPSTATLAEADMSSDYAVDLTQDGVGMSGRVGEPPALYRDPAGCVTPIIIT